MWTLLSCWSSAVHSSLSAVGEGSVGTGRWGPVGGDGLVGEGSVGKGRWERVGGDGSVGTGRWRKGQLRKGR